MDEVIKNRIVKGYKRALLHTKIGGEIKLKGASQYKKVTLRRRYLIRRGERAKLKLTQYESIPRLSAMTLL